MVALADGGAEMPPKIGVHPRPGALIHAMPAALHGRDLVGVKWVSAFPGNRALGLPAIHGLVVLNDAETGVPVAVMEAGVITAVRTAAVSGVAIELFAPAGANRVAILGAGVQARSHLPVVAALVPDADVAIFDRHSERAEALADVAREMPGIAAAQPAGSAEAAAGEADIVITVASFGPTRQVMGPEWLRRDALVVAVDFAMYASAQLAASAAAFVVDDDGQFRAYRDAGHFDGYPDPTTTLGRAALPADGRGDESSVKAGDGRTVLVTHLGVGLADVLFADAVLRRAVAEDVGVLLPR